MKIVNIGCGGIRPQGESWWNIDNLRTQLPEGSGARVALDSEPRYIEHDLVNPIPFPDGEFDGVLLAHVLEHFDAQAGLRLILDCKRVLKSGGILLVSVPNASYFRSVYAEDRNENWMRLFEVSDPQNPIPTFFEAALWFDQHKMIFAHDSLWAYFRMAGLNNVQPLDNDVIRMIRNGMEESPGVRREMVQYLDRLPFSLVMSGARE